MSEKLLEKQYISGLTNIGRSSEAFEGSPAPSAIQGFAGDPLL